MRSRHVVRWLVLVVLSSVGPAARAQEAPPEPDVLAETLARLVARPGGLTGAQVADRAEATSLDMAAGRAQIDAAGAGVVSADVQLAPRLNLTVRYTRLSEITEPLIGILVAAPQSGPGVLPAGATLVNVPIVASDIFNRYSADAVLAIPVSDYLLSISHTRAAARHSERAARWNEQALRLKTRADAKITYYSWARVRLSVAVAQQALVDVRLHLHDVDALFRHGAASSADVLRVQSQLAETEQLVAQALDQERVALEQLRTIMHDDRLVAWDIGEDLAPLPTTAEPTEFGALVAVAARDRYEVRALGESEAAAIEGATAARAAVVPRLGAFGTLTSADPSPRYFPIQDRLDNTWTAGVELSWSPNGAVEASVQGHVLDAQAKEVAARRGAVIDGLRSEVSQALQAWDDACVAILTSARSLAASEESYRARRSLFVNQGATSTELLDAETDLLRARLAVVDARLDQHIARVRVDHATGRDGRSP
jgi:outer membrane protein